MDDSGGTAPERIVGLSSCTSEGVCPPKLSTTSANRSAGEPIEPEQTDVVAGLSAHGEIGHDLADDAAELVAVPAEARGDAHLRSVGKPIDDEVLVGAVGEDAGLEHLGRTGAVGEVALGETTQRSLVARTGG